MSGGRMADTTQSAAQQLKELDVRAKAVDAEANTVRKRIGEIDFEIGNINLSGLATSSLTGLRKDKQRLQAQLEELALAADVAKVRRSDLEKRKVEERDTASAEAFYAEKAAKANALPEIARLGEQMIAVIETAVTSGNGRAGLFDAVIEAITLARNDSTAHRRPRQTLTERLAELEAVYRRQAAPAVAPLARGVRQRPDTAVHTSEAVRFRDSANSDRGEFYIPKNWIGLLPPVAAERAGKLGLATALVWPPPGKRFVDANAVCRLDDDTVVRPGFPRLVDSTLAEARLERGELFEPEAMPADVIASFRKVHTGEPISGPGSVDLGDLQDERWTPEKVVRPRSSVFGYAEAMV